MQNKIKQLRHQKKWTLEQIAERLDTSPQYVGLMENGKRNLSQKWMVRFASVFGCQPEDIISDRDINTTTTPLNPSVMVNCIIETINAAAEETNITGETLPPETIARYSMATYIEHMEWLMKHSQDPDPTARLSGQAANVVRIARALRD